MAAAKDGDTVKIHYTGKLTDQTKFDSSEGRDPLEFTIGSGMVIPGFDNAVTGMEVGEKKTVTIPCDEAYGQKDDRAILKMEKSQLPEGMEVTVGDQLQMSSPEGMPIPVVVTAVEEESFTIDANHHLAGEDLIFDLELVEILA